MPSHGRKLQMKHSALIRILALTLGLTLAAVPALAETPTETLVAGLRALAFEQSNVTLTAKADFSWDGELFKHLDITQKQDGPDSMQSVSLTTPRKGEKDYVGSYTVYGQDTRVYAIESFNDQYYRPSRAPRSTSLVRQTATRKALLDAVSAVMSTMEQNLTATQRDGQTDFRFTLKDGEAPALVGSVLSALAVQAVRLRGFGYDSDPVGCQTLYDDYWTALINWATTNGADEAELTLLKRCQNGEEMTSEEYKTCDRIFVQFNKMTDEYDSGVLYVKNDGKTEWFETYSDYLRSRGLVSLTYEDHDRALLSYYNQKYGKSLDLAAFNALRYSDEGAQELSSLPTLADDYYTNLTRKTPDAVAGLVKADGTVEAYTDLDAADSEGGTPTQRILNGLTGLKLSSADVTVRTDAQTRVESIGGNATFTVTDRDDKEHALRLEFEAKATDYGTTTFERFDPKTTKLPSADEYYNGAAN